MNLLVLILGVFAAAGVVRQLAPGRCTWTQSIGAFAAIVGLMALASGTWSNGHQLITERAGFARATEAQHRAGTGAAFGAREDVLQVADDTIPRRASVYLACQTCVGNGLDEWITYRLTPRPFRDRAADADWVLIYNSTAAKSRLRESDLTDVRTIAPGFQIARVR